jgi:phosphatidylserine/phosphatidylglycerophosphate/cardiolipin synthase-like enzyme
VHAKACIVDDTWASIGSDNFNRRSWTHDSELSAVVVERGDAGPARYARDLRLTLAAEHLDRSADPATLAEVMADCVDPVGMFDAYARVAEGLDAWHESGRTGPRPAGRLRRLSPPELSRRSRVLALAPYLLLHDPDGRPRPLRRRNGF